MFEENIDVLFEELDLAIQWGRPSILLAVNKSKFGMDKSQKTLEERLRKAGRNPVRISVNKEHSDVPHLIASEPAAGETIFFVSNLDWGGGQDGKDAYRSLNLHREFFVDKHIKAVFWLSDQEAAHLPRYAPDFWAFRHRVIEFSGLRGPKNISLPAGILLWGGLNPIDPFERSEERISAREELLAKLPRNMESLSTRLDLLYNLGYLYWLSGDIGKASSVFAAGLELVNEHPLPQARSALLNGMAIIAYEEKNYDQAIETFKAAIQDNPEDGRILINLGAACCVLGRNQAAIINGKRAARINPEDPGIMNRLGYLYLAAGKSDEAITPFTKAAELAPQSAAFHESLAVAYSLMERSDEARRELAIARRLIAKHSTIYLDIYETAIFGNPDRSGAMIQAAMRSNQISRQDVQRDLNIHLLLSPAQIKDLQA